MLGTSDGAKKIADFSSKQTHVTYWMFEEDADQVKKNRPDAVHFVNAFPGYCRQAARRQDAVQRQARAPGAEHGDRPQADQRGHAEGPRRGSTRGSAGRSRSLGFRKPAELPGAKYWKFDLQAAKQLMSAAGITAPIEITLHHWDATVVGQGVVDQAIAGRDAVAQRRLRQLEGRRS